MSSSAALPPLRQRQQLMGNDNERRRLLNQPKLNLPLLKQGSKIVYQGRPILLGYLFQLLTGEPICLFRTR